MAAILDTIYKSSAQKIEGCLANINITMLKAWYGVHEITTKNSETLFA